MSYLAGINKTRRRFLYRFTLYDGTRLYSSKSILRATRFLKPHVVLHSNENVVVGQLFCHKRHSMKQITYKYAQLIGVKRFVVVDGKLARTQRITVSSVHRHGFMFSRDKRTRYSTYGYYRYYINSVIIAILSFRRSFPTESHSPLLVWQSYFTTYFVIRINRL